MRIGKKAVSFVLAVCVLGALAALLLPASRTEAGSAASEDYQRARWDPVHFKPAIDTASDEKCLSCHKEVLDNTVREESPAGVKAIDALAWYQTLDTYEGEQATFHWRHIKSPYASAVMQMKCTTCHQGNDPRDRAVNPPDIHSTAFTLRKDVNPDTCLMCHGKFPNENMGLPPWPEIRDSLQNNCLSCHAAFRTNRHQVNYLKPEAIEKLAQDKGGDVCFGCHGGRQWYRIGFPYPRHAWPDMPEETPEWARNRPTESDIRFLDKVISANGSKQ